MCWRRCDQSTGWSFSQRRCEQLWRRCLQLPRTGWPPTSMPKWVQRYGARADSYRLPQGEDKRTKLAVQVGTDGFDLLEAVHADHAPAWLGEGTAVVVPGDGVDHAVSPHGH
jgi:hypothetical protein